MGEFMSQCLREGTLTKYQAMGPSIKANIPKSQDLKQRLQEILKLNTTWDASAHQPSRQDQPARRSRSSGTSPWCIAAARLRSSPEEAGQQAVSALPGDGAFPTWIYILLFRDQLAKTKWHVSQFPGKEDSEGPVPTVLIRSTVIKKC